jgi:hypothetical protein
LSVGGWSSDNQKSGRDAQNEHSPACGFVWENTGILGLFGGGFGLGLAARDDCNVSCNHFGLFYSAILIHPQMAP